MSRVPLRAVVALLVFAVASTAGAAVSVSTAFRQNGNRIVATSELGTGFFGSSVALSADGRTAIVGGQFDDGGKGAAWVLTRSGDGWVQEQKLTPTDEVGAGNFGCSVALSADGTTALVGARYDNSQGAAWAFTRVRQAGAASPWRQQGPKLTGSSPSGEGPPSLFGWSVSLSADGNVAVIGAPNTQRSTSGQGVAWAFFRSGGVWTRQSHELTELSYKPAAQFGTSVAVAGDGLSALVGAPTYGPGSGIGRGHVARFVRPVPSGGFVETSQDAYPAVDDSMAFGSSVALSFDGTMAVVGAPGYGNGVGSVWAYSYPPPGPTPPTLLGTLIPRDRVATNGAFGTSVGLSRDGDVFTAGAPRESGDRGAIWVYARTRTSWDQQGSRIEAGGEAGAGRLGTSVAIAADGHSAIAGGPWDDTQVGATWSFVDRAAVTSLSPASGPTTGGTQVTMAGSGFANAVRVAFGSMPAASFTVLSPTLIRAVSPPGKPGVVDVTVTTSGGASAPAGGAKFRYVAPAQPSPPSPPPTSPPPASPPPSAPSSRDRRAPTRPTSLRGTLLGSTLRLTWRVARDDVRLAHHVLYRDGRRVRTVGPKTTRLFLRHFRAARRTVLRLRGVDAAGHRSAASNPVIVHPLRGGGYRIVNRRR